MKIPEFAQHFQLSEPKIADMGEFKMGFEINTLIQPVEDLENAISEEIIKIAKEEGINDLYLLNKRAIVFALEKQIPKKPKIYNNIYPKDLYECSLCGCGLRANKSWKDTYCPNCGVKIDWSDTE